MKKNILIPLCLIFVPVLSQELITDRPDITESPYLVPQYHMQFEHGFSYGWGTITSLADPVSETDYGIIQIASTLMRLNIGQQVELRFEFNPTITKMNDTSVTGLPPMGLGVKTRLFKGKGAIPQVAVLTTLYPGLLATENMQPEANQFVYKVAANHSFTDWFNLSYNFGALVSNKNAPVYLYSLSTGYSINDKLSCFAEGYGNISTESKFAENLIFDAGITYLISPLLQADISAGTGKSNTNNYYFGSMGFSYMFSLKKTNG